MLLFRSILQRILLDINSLLRVLDDQISNMWSQIANRGVFYSRQHYTVIRISDSIACN